MLQRGQYSFSCLFCKSVNTYGLSWVNIYVGYVEVPLLLSPTRCSKSKVWAFSSTWEPQSPYEADGELLVVRNVVASVAVLLYGCCRLHTPFTLTRACSRPPPLIPRLAPYPIAPITPIWSRHLYPPFHPSNAHFANIALSMSYDSQMSPSAGVW